jgi:hypothetical protein
VAAFEDVLDDATARFRNNAGQRHFIDSTGSDPVQALIVADADQQGGRLRQGRFPCSLDDRDDAVGKLKTQTDAQWHGFFVIRRGLPES